MQPALFFCLSTLGCPDATWEEVVELAKAHRFLGIELRFLQGSMDLPSVLKKRFVSPESMAATVEKSGIPVVSLNTSLHLLNSGEEQFREALALAPWADALHIPFLRVFDGGTSGGGLNPEVRAKMRRALGEWASIRKKHRFKCDLMIETHWALAASSAVFLLGREIEVVGGALHLLWDSGHTWNYSHGEPENEWELMKPWVRHIHIKDGMIIREKFHDMLPGEGQFPILSLLKALRRDGFTGPVSLEWERMWNPALPPLEKALESGRRHGWWTGK